MRDHRHDLDTISESDQNKAPVCLDASRQCDYGCREWFTDPNQALGLLDLQCGIPYCTYSYLFIEHKLILFFFDLVNSTSVRRLRDAYAS